jgi:hypothetical protein
MLGLCHAFALHSLTHVNRPVRSSDATSRRHPVIALQQSNSY